MKKGDVILDDFFAQLFELAEALDDEADEADDDAEAE